MPELSGIVFIVRRKHNVFKVDIVWRERGVKMGYLFGVHYKYQQWPEIDQT